MALDPLLVEVLACPEDKGPLLVFDDLLYNPRLRRAYAINDGIPVMLVDEARAVDEDEHGQLLDRAEREQVPTTGGGSAPAAGPAGAGGAER